MYSEQDLQYASALREEIHKEALAIARTRYPGIQEVVDTHPIEDYFQKSWEYPGRWYTVVAIPYGYKSRAAFVEALAENTVETYLKNRNEETDEPFYKLLAQYPDSVVDYCLVRLDEPYAGAGSHFTALLKGAVRIIADNRQMTVDKGRMTARKIPTAALFAPVDTNAALNYRTAFLRPPHGNGYQNADFDKINHALFPNGTDGLEVFEWSTDWSDYFDDGREWWGTLCLTVYDRSRDRFVVILASATD